MNSRLGALARFDQLPVFLAFSHDASQLQEFLSARGLTCKVSDRVCLWLERALALLRHPPKTAFVVDWHGARGMRHGRTRVEVRKDCATRRKRANQEALLLVVKCS